MEVGSLIECYSGYLAIILDIEYENPGHPRSLPESVLLYFPNDIPAWHTPGLYDSISSIKKVVSNEES